MWRVLVFAQKHQSLLTYGSKKQIIIIVKILNSEHEYSSPCHPQNQVKVLPKWRRSEHDPEHVSLLLATTHFHWLRQSMRQIKIYNPFWKTWMLHPLDWRSRGPSSLLSAPSLKACISDGMQEPIEFATCTPGSALSMLKGIYEF